MIQSTMRRARLALGGFVCVTAMWGAAAGALAAVPQLEFDTSYTVECRDVTPRDFAVRYPDSRIVEAKFRVSTWFTAGREADLDELIVEITSPNKTLPVVDFMPRTELDTDIAGAIEVVESDEHTTSTNAGVGGSVGVEYGIVRAQATPSAGGGKTHLSSTKETYKRLPPKQLLLASGTINRGYGVFFKLKPSPQAALEGVREFACLFLVPHDWRGQAVQVSCSALATKRSYFSSTTERCGEGTFYVGLFLEGDMVARTTVEELAKAEGRKAADELAQRQSGATSWTAFKPLNQAVHASRNLFPIYGKQDSPPVSRAKAQVPRNDPARDTAAGESIE
ncbi:MAG: hypothetical protein JNG90_16855 [Planctomycetaceae bacterium]|nr:hypothetical protein [Planctomycetaceae bacterium]